MAKAIVARSAPPGLAKCSTGIPGLDEITGGGLPQGRPTLICGGPGCGKTLLAMEFLVRGAVEHGEPGVFIAFEETPDELAANVRSLGFDLDALVVRKKMLLEHILIDRSEMEENGEYDLDGLFIRIGYAIDAIGAKRVVLDTIETLFGGLDNQAILRSELRRLFRFLKDKGVTAVVTAERGDGTLTRQGLEEYVSDCVILLDHRVRDQVSTRRIRIVKYRGTAHGTNEYPFLIDRLGISVLPITSMTLDHQVSTERLSTGQTELDGMLSDAGVYRGSSVLISGTAGTGKSILAAHFARACIARGERCLYYAFEEANNQVIRNMRTVGIDFRPAIKKGLLQIVSARPTSAGIETHLSAMHRDVRAFAPSMVVVDPISNLSDAGTMDDANALLSRLFDFFKSQQITGVFTALIRGGAPGEATDVGISSVIDTWILLRDIEHAGERNRALNIIKSRGMAHSNKAREFQITSLGVQLSNRFVGGAGVLGNAAPITRNGRSRAPALPGGRT